MQLHGVHHVTCITADAPGNVEFYANTLGLRLVKKTVNQDDPTVYHLFYADELGSAGADITFFEYPGVPVGRAGDGMVHRIVFRVGSEASLDFWADRLESARRAHGRVARLHRSRGARAGADRRRLGRSAAGRARSRDPRGARDPRLRGRPRVRVAARSGARRCSRRWGSPAPRPAGRRAASAAAASTSTTRRPRPPGLHGAGTVHHVAWASLPDEHEDVARARARGRALTDAHRRPLLLQVDLLPRAERRPLRDRDDRPRASPPTSRSRRSASRCRCRRTSSTSATGSPAC